MIRFIDLRGQILTADDEPNFAFFCTVYDRFEKFGDTQEWTSLEEFIEDYYDEAKQGTVINPLGRYLNLIPVGYFGNGDKYVQFAKTFGMIPDDESDNSTPFRDPEIDFVAITKEQKEMFENWPPIPVHEHFNCSGKYVFNKDAEGAIKDLDGI